MSFRKDFNGHSLKYVYYKDEHSKILHREDGPALEYLNGKKYWFIDGKIHREDGPAIEWIYNNWVSESYYLNNEFYSKEEYWAIIRFGGFV